MNPRGLLFALVTAGMAFAAHAAAPPVLVIHGGAGVIRHDMSPEKQRAVRAALTLALTRGYAQLKAGSPALDAVAAALTVLEDDPNFNAGKGAVFTHDGRQRAGRCHHGRQKPAGGGGGWRAAGEKSDPAGACCDESFLACDAVRRGCRGVCRKCRHVAGRSVLFPYRRTLAAMAEGAQAGRRRYGAWRIPGRPVISVPSARWRWMRVGTWPQARPPAV